MGEVFRGHKRLLEEWGWVMFWPPVFSVFKQLIGSANLNTLTTAVIISSVNVVVQKCNLL